MSKKPLVWSEDRSDIDRYDPRRHRGQVDPSRIPGYSEIVRANDIDKADDLWFREQNQGRTKEDLFAQIGAKPQKLPVEFAWLRVSDAGGQNSSTADRDLDRYTNQEGFRLANPADLEKYGYGMPPTARKAEDGSIRRGPDVALFVRDGEVARAWERFRAEEAAAADGAAIKDSFEGSRYQTDTFTEADERQKRDIAH